MFHLFPLWSRAQRANTWVTCARARAQAATCAAVGVTSASCIAIAAASAALLAPSRVGGGVGAPGRANPRGRGRAADGASDSTWTRSVPETESAKARAPRYATRERAAASYISRVSAASCRSPAADVLTRGSRRSVSGWVYDFPFTVRRTVYRPGGAHGAAGVR